MSNTNYYEKMAGAFPKKDRKNAAGTNAAETFEHGPLRLWNLIHQSGDPEVWKLYEKWMEQFRATVRLEIELELALLEAAKKPLDEGLVSPSGEAPKEHPEETLESTPDDQEEKPTSLQLADGSELILDEVPWCDGPISLRTMETWMVAMLPEDLQNVEARCQRSLVELAAELNRACRHVEAAAGGGLAEFYLMVIHSMLQHSQAR